MEQVAKLLEACVLLAILTLIASLIALVVGIIYKLNLFSNLIPKQVFAPKVEPVSNVPAPDEPKGFWDDAEQLQKALDSSTDFSDLLPTDISGLPPLDQQREIADRVLELRTNK